MYRRTDGSDDVLWRRSPGLRPRPGGPLGRRRRHRPCLGVVEGLRGATQPHVDDDEDDDRGDGDEAEPGDHAEDEELDAVVDVGDLDTIVLQASVDAAAAPVTRQTYKSVWYN